MNKKLLLLLIPIFFSIWWIVTPQETYVTRHISYGWAFQCWYNELPTAFEVFGYAKEDGSCSVYQHFFHENHEVIDNQWRCTGEMCVELGVERYEK